MSNFDWKKIIGTVAPAVASLIGGPMSAIAVKSLSNIFLGKDDGSEDEVAQAVLTGMTPDKIVELQKLNKEHEEKMAEIGFDYAKLNQTTELAYVDDTKDARKYHTNNTFWLGVAILSMFAVTMGMSLFGAYQILSGGITIKDVATVAAVSGFIGSIIGYVASASQQVIGYFYGSSSGSSKKTDALAESIKNIGNGK